MTGCLVTLTPYFAAGRAASNKPGQKVFKITEEQDVANRQPDDPGIPFHPYTQRQRCV
jgi:hypothetical protein